MKYGKTNKYLVFDFGFVRGPMYQMPPGTPVVYGQKDCDGDPFPHWTLPEHIARELSGNGHDSKHRFVVVHPDHIEEIEQEEQTQWKTSASRIM